MAESFEDRGAHSDIRIFGQFGSARTKQPRLGFWSDKPPNIARTPFGQSDSSDSSALISDTRPVSGDLVLFRTFGSFGQLGQSRAELVTEFRDKFLTRYSFYHKNTLKIKRFIEIDTVLGSTEINFNQLRLVMYDFCPRSLGNSALRLSETVRMSTPAIFTFFN